MGPEGEEPLLSVVIPAYNEAPNLRRGVLEELARYLGSRPYPSEVLVVDDGSQDETAGLVEEFCRGHPTFQLLRSDHGGKARAVVAGLRAARGRYVMFMDMDLATSLEHIDELVAALEGGADVVIGSREMRGSVRIGTPLSRRLLGRGFSLLIRALLLPGLSDTQCGFKGFRREAARELIEAMVVFRERAPVSGPRVTAFDVELLVAARERGWRIREIPVTWRHFKSPRVSLLREPLLMLREVLAIWWARLRGRYRPRSPGSRDGR